VNQKGGGVVVRGNIAYTGRRSARRLTPFRRSIIFAQRVSRTTREPLRPSKSAAARPLYKLHVNLHEDSTSNPPTGTILATFHSQVLDPSIRSRCSTVYTSHYGERSKDPACPEGCRQETRCMVCSRSCTVLIRTLFYFQTLSHCCDEVFVSRVHTGD
jgi:hypothetical protein